MTDQSEFNDKALTKKFKSLFDENSKIKKWNEGIFIKSLILLPIIIFIIGLFTINRIESLKDILLTLLYPLVLVSIGLILLFCMRSNLK